MDCIVWAARQARETGTTSSTSGAVTTTEPGLSEHDLQEIMTVSLVEKPTEINDVTPAQEDDDTDDSGDESEHVGGEESAENSDEEVDCSEDDDDDEYDLGVARLRKECSSCDTLSLRGRQLKLLLQKAEEQQRQMRKASKKCRERQIQQRRKTLVDFGVMSEEDAVQLIKDPKAPLPPDLQEKWNRAYQERKKNEEMLRKQHELKKVGSIFQNEWLIRTEREMANVNKELSSLGPDQINKKTALRDLLEIYSNKLKMFHEKEGTFKGIGVGK